MPSDSKSKITRKNQNKSKKMDELKKRRKSNEHSDSSDDNYSSDSETEEMDPIEYRKFLATMFPSKHLNKKIKAGEKLKKCLEEEELDEEDSDSDYEDNAKIIKDLNTHQYVCSFNANMTTFIYKTKKWQEL